MKEMLTLLREKGGFKNNRIARLIDQGMDEKGKSKLYNLFLNLVDKETSEDLKLIDSLLKKYIKDLESKSGWVCCYDMSFKLVDNFKNMNDSEFGSFDTYTVYYDEDIGYYVDDFEPFNGYFLSIQDGEKNFFNKYSKELTLIHQLLTRKRVIMSGDYSLKNDSDLELVRCISEFLGYTSNSASDKFIYLK